MKTMVMLSITSFFVLMFTSTATYCGNYPYSTVDRQCLCDNLSCCTPELFPNVCCKNSTLPLPLLGEWILTDTNDANNMIDAESPLIFSYEAGVPYVVQIPWLNILGGPKTITYKFKIELSCHYSEFASTPNDPSGSLMVLYAYPPYHNISLAYSDYKGYFVPVNQSKLDLIS